MGAACSFDLYSWFSRWVLIIAMFGAFLCHGGYRIEEARASSTPAFWRVDWGGFAERLERQSEDGFSKLDLFRLRRQQGKTYCHDLRRFLIEDGRLDIRVAYGYFDAVYGKKISFSYWEADPWSIGNDIFGRSLISGKSIAPALDGEEFLALMGLLTKKCPVNQPDRWACGFEVLFGGPGLRRVVLKKNITWDGQPVPAYITVTFSSASPFHEKNIGELSALQNQLSWQSARNFLEGLGSADVVFYVGHSRKLGGPDFWPPVLRSGDFKVNYDYYNELREGRRLLLTWLQARRNVHGVLGLISCESHLFLSDVLDVHPSLSVIYTKKQISSFESTVGLALYLDSILGGKCVSDVTQFLNQKIIKSDFYETVNF
ncbi:MAG: hypothetical protein RMK80_00920 [Pseudobdellovibrionaceae bacterium]|nr:hypothetical protein [Pseudobdellovibrionaceae bacterium]